MGEGLCVRKDPYGPVDKTPTDLLALVPQLYIHGFLKDEAKGN